MGLIWEYLKEDKIKLFGALMLSLVHQVFSLLSLQILRVSVDQYITQAESLSRQSFVYGSVFLLVVLVFIFFIAWLAGNFKEYFSSILAQEISSQIFADSLSHIFSIPYQNFEDQKTGEIIQKLNKSKNEIQAWVYKLTGSASVYVTSIVLILSYCFYVNFWLGLSFLITAPVVVLIIFFLKSRIKEIEDKINIKTIFLTGSTTESLRNIELVKSLGLDNQEIERFHLVNDGILDLNKKKFYLIRFLNFFQGIIINLFRGLIIFLMLLLIYENKISLGEFLGIIFYLFLYFSNLESIGNLTVQYHEVGSSFKQLNTILTIPKEIKNEKTKEIKKISSITFENVDFVYKNKESGVSQINFEIKPGETIAFVGFSGAGKTTLAKLILGLYQPRNGKILINNLDSNFIDLNFLKKRIGLVTQETQLFSGTIKENLLFLKPEATDEECLEVLQKVSLEKLATKSGLATLIGEGGIKISGGERQRLAIARALLRKPDVLILDEATSNLDSLTEKTVMETIKNIKLAYPDLITIIITHRLSVVTSADKIMVVSGGRIVESGSHQKLLSKVGVYAEMWEHQMKHREAIKADIF
ncbi:MAG: ABC transporter ATP-binding protein [Candidatus Paceibacterota bacterium]|jgi:ATP-binding cassette subfamily B protein